MPAAKTRTELKVTVKNQPGQLTEVLSTVSKAGCNLLAFCGFSTGPEQGEILMVADHEGKARKALQAAGYEPELNKVLVVPSPSGKGAGAKLASKLSGLGINIQYAYASSAPDGRSTAVFRIPESDLDRALKALS